MSTSLYGFHESERLYILWEDGKTLLLFASRYTAYVHGCGAEEVFREMMW